MDIQQFLWRVILVFILATACSLNICLYRAVKMVFFFFVFLPPRQKQQISPKANKLPSIERILCTTGFYKLPGLSLSQIKTYIQKLHNLYYILVYIFRTFFRSRIILVFQPIWFAWIHIHSKHLLIAYLAKSHLLCISDGRKSPKKSLVVHF